MPFTLKQQRFIDFYEGNGAEAAVKAGYAERTARITASQLLTNPNISEAIKNRTAKADKSVIWSREQRQKFWSDVSNDPKVSMSDRLRASELLGKSGADFIERREVEVKERRLLIVRADEPTASRLPSEVETVAG